MKTPDCLRERVPYIADGAEWNEFASERLQQTFPGIVKILYYMEREDLYYGREYRERQLYHV